MKRKLATMIFQRYGLDEDAIPHYTDALLEESPATDEETLRFVEEELHLDAARWKLAQRQVADDIAEEVIGQ